MMKRRKKFHKHIVTISGNPKVILAHNSGTKAKKCIESYFGYKNKKQIVVQAAIHDHESKISVNRY